MSLFDIRSKVVWWLGGGALVILSAVMFILAVFSTSIDSPIRGDARDYLGYAYNIKVHGIYSRSWATSVDDVPVSDALRAPGYPWFLSLFVNSDSKAFLFEQVLFMQATLGVLTVVIYLSLFRRCMSTGWALFAGLVVAISPHLVNASVYILTETLFTFLLGGHLLLLEKAIRLKNNNWALGAGLLLAASLLVRPTTQYLFLFYFLLADVGMRATLFRHWRWLCYLFGPVLLTIVGWATRNLIEVGHVSDPRLTANFLQHGMYVNMMYEGLPESYGYPYRFDPMNAEYVGKPLKVLEAIWRYFLQEPARYLSWYLIGKPMQFFAWNLTESVGDAFIYQPIYSPYFDKALFGLTHSLSKLLHPFMMCLGVLGAFIAVVQQKRNLVAMLMSAVVLYFLILHMIGAPFPRYSIPIRPICYGLAFFTLQTITQWVWNRFNEVKM